jgi:small subunit ribosomal protein S2
MPVASMIELLEAGVHFGHQTQRWNPKMKPFIYGARNGIYVIDLRKTTDLLDKAYAVVREFAAKNKNILFVGTKKQAADVVAEEAKRAGAYYINKRWLGGMLTNFETVRGRVNKLRELEEFIESGHIEKLPKKEVAQIQRQVSKLSKTLGGIKEMRGLPELIFVIDQQKEDIAIKEANKLNIPVICLADTNANPDGIDYLVPGNDDAIRSIQLLTSKFADAILEGKQLRENKAAEGKKIEEIKAEDAGVKSEEVKAEKAASEETAKVEG